METTGKVYHDTMILQRIKREEKYKNNPLRAMKPNKTVKKNKNKTPLIFIL